MRDLLVTSRVFDNNEHIPRTYTCDGANINPPLSITDIPEEAQSLVLIVDDPDAPNGTWTHWVVWNILPTGEIPEDSVPGVPGRNTFNTNEWGGPCPPSGAHRYCFNVFALDESLDLETGTPRDVLEETMKEHVVAKGQLVGIYERKG